MQIADVVFATGMGSFLHHDRAAVIAGATPNGYLYDGDPVTPGFSQVSQPSGTVSIMLLLENGAIALGDCADVILAGYAGRDRPFLPEEHIGTLETVLAPRLIGRELSGFREMAAEFDALQVDGRPMHMALRYGVTQALLDAHALAGGRQMAEVVAEEYGTTVSDRRLRILSSCMRDNHNLHDRMILKQADILPHSSFADIDIHIGWQGEIFLDYVAKFASRVREIGAPGYAPQLHFDVYGSIGKLHDNDPEGVADYLARVVEAVAPFDLMIESPFVMETIEAQIDIFGALKAALVRKGTKVTIIADEWCNTLEDIRAWADSATTDMVQIKTPDLGGINNSIEAVLYCRDRGMGCYLGGTANETHQSSRVTTHVGMATGPDFVLSKPGMGGDESYALMVNEMNRLLALRRRARPSLAGTRSDD